MRLCALVFVLTIALVPPAAHAWLPEKPIADPLYTEILRLENARDTGARLRELAGHESPIVRARALRALARAQQSELAPLFAEKLADPDASVRDEAAFGMGLLWEQGDPAPLIEAYGREKDPRVRASLARAVGRCATAENGVSFLAGLAADADTTTSKEACLALGIAGYRKVDVQSALESLGQAAARSRHAGTRRAAAYAIFRGYPDRAPRYLKPLLKDPDPLVRMYVVRGLAASKRDNLVVAISELVRDSDWRVRLEAIKALAALRAVSFSSLMSLGLDDPVAMVRLATIEALGQLGLTQSLQFIDPIYRESDDARIRAAALLAKAHIEGEGILPTAEQARNSSEWIIRRAAAEALGLIRSDQARAVLGQMTIDQSPQVLAQVATSLTDYPQLAALDDLVFLLKSGDPVVLTTAASALGQRGDRQSIGPLVETYGRLSSPADREPMMEILGALSRIAVPVNTGLVRGSLSKSDRGTIARTLTAALKDGDRLIGQAAAAALERIDGRNHDAEIAGPPVDYPLYAEEIAALGAAPKVRLQTRHGAIEIELLPGEAPNSVANYLHLVRQGFFNGLNFHRVVPGFVTQDGCPRGDGWGDPGYAIRCEYNDLSYEEGMVGMALSGKDTGGSQYFIIQTPQPHLDGRYTIFGRVTKGLENLQQITPGEVVESVEVTTP